jgi:hypothetical protein
MLTELSQFLIVDGKHEMVIYDLVGFTAGQMGKNRNCLAKFGESFPCRTRSAVYAYHNSQINMNRSVDNIMQEPPKQNFVKIISIATLGDDTRSQTDGNMDRRPGIATIL